MFYCTFVKGSNISAWQKFYGTDIFIHEVPLLKTMIIVDVLLHVIWGWLAQ